MELEQSRLNYLNCKLSEMLQSEVEEALPPPPVELKPDIYPKRSITTGPRVKFVSYAICRISLVFSFSFPICGFPMFLKADTPHIIVPPRIEPLLSSGSILHVMQRPLPQNSGRKYSSPLFMDVKRRSVRASRDLPPKLSYQDTCGLLQEILEKLDMLELSKETQNYIKIKLRMFYLGGHLSIVFTAELECLICTN